MEDRWQTSEKEEKPFGKLTLYSLRFNAIPFDSHLNMTSTVDLTLLVLFYAATPLLTLLLDQFAINLLLFRWCPFRFPPFSLPLTPSETHEPP